MNKQEMSDKLAARTGLTKAKAKQAVDALFGGVDGAGILAGELGAGKKVVIPGFGTFGVHQRSARNGVNPATGAKITIAAKKVVRFKPGTTLRERMERRG